MSNFKVLFIYPNFRSETLVPPGITLLSRILKNHGFSVDLFDTTDYGLDLSKDYDRSQESVLSVRATPHRPLKYAGRDVWKDLNDKVVTFQPDLIALSCTESTFLLGVEAIRRISHREVPVVLGGVFATFAPRVALSFPEIDIVCLGEGERPLPELCERMRKGEPYQNVKGLWVKERDGSIRRNPLPQLVNMDDNPTDFDLGLFDPERLMRPMTGALWQMTPVETIRGCPYHCTFCNSPSQSAMFEGSGERFVRKKSLRKVHEELLYYKNQFGAEYMYFWADTFLLMSRAELDEFCEMYQDIRLPFWIQTRVETITDWRLRALKDVGLHRVAFGIENGDEHFRQTMLRKEFSNDDAVRQLQIVADLDIPFSTNNMVGFPFETREIAMETVKLNRRLPRPDNTSCAIFTPFYGTVARDVAVEAGFMDPDLIAPGITEDSVLSMPEFPADEIRKFRRAFALYVGFPEERWPEIRRAEEETPEGNTLLARLQAEYRETFFAEPKSQY